MTWLDVTRLLKHGSNSWHDLVSCMFWVQLAMVQLNHTWTQIHSGCIH